MINKSLGGGVGAARNSALPLITGEFVLFVDNDDWLEPNHIEVLYKSLKETDSDISIVNFTQFMEERSSYAFHVTEKDYFQEVFTPQNGFLENTMDDLLLVSALLFPGVSYIKHPYLKTLAIQKMKRWKMITRRGSTI
ncbi:putative glycosyltransferase (galT2) [Streptococcus suis]|uniref:Putative glycosyltransferase (GalT2) n=1 Tax=Streptococcus suis TaxID=1307 RepID=A0A123STH8_STRSU|nr:putative glycosyltransferase (galT2) [Streptococcus suis]CYU54030.1 putative glycosyltransferase (galT2) [Streptococcus suis]